MWLEDRGKMFWFFTLTVLLVVSGTISQIAGNGDLINFIDARPVWFFISVFWLAMFASMISRIYFPLLLGAPPIIRKERLMIRQYRIMTFFGLIVGAGLCILLIGAEHLWAVFPGTVLLLTVPVAVMWGYLALVLNDTDYEDDRTWSFLSELGAGDRLEHRHHGFFVLVGVPLAGLIYYYFVTHPWLAWAIKDSTVLAMFRELWRRAKERGAGG